MAKSFIPYRISYASAKHEYAEDVDLYDIDGGLFPDKVEFAKRIDADIKKKANGEGSGVELSNVEYGGCNINIIDESLSSDKPEETAIKKAEEYIEKYDFLESGDYFTIKFNNNEEIDAMGSDVPKYEIEYYFPRKALNIKYGDYIKSTSSKVIINDNMDVKASEELQEALEEEIKKSKILRDL